jgi:4-amino-4-deoxy-L-arabinose transferase-like glycosyltransferase
MAVLPRPWLFAAPNQMTLPSYVSMAGPISCIAGSTSITGGLPSSFHAFDEVL